MRTIVLRDTVRQPENCPHDWVPAPAWVIHKDGYGPSADGLLANGYCRLWCWRCRISVDVPSRKEAVV